MHEAFGFVLLLTIDSTQDMLPPGGLQMAVVQDPAGGKKNHPS